MISSIIYPSLHKKFNYYTIILTYISITLYELLIYIKVSDEQSSEIFEKKGQLSVSTDGGLKITRDWEDHVKIEDVSI
jgi:hypothetical protein